MEKEIPFCTVCLVFCALTAHTLVLTGNIMVSNAFHEIGDAAYGWAGVGHGVGNSLKTELRDKLGNISSNIDDTITTLESLESSLNNISGFVGPIIDKLEDKMSSTLGAGVDFSIVPEDQKAALIEQHDMIPDLVITTAVSAVFLLIDDAAKNLVDKMKPAFLLVGNLMDIFSIPMLNSMETFGVTMDFAQKMFDQIGGSTGKLSGKATVPGSGEAMEHETFTLFDVSNTGAITTQDLKDVARLYSIDALKGQKADTMLRTYDADFSKTLDREEFHRFVQDSTIPKSMAIVLSAYAQKLSEFIGAASQSKVRSQVADALVDYLQLVSAKNMTKVGWVSEALTNKSVSDEFSIDVLWALGKATEDPDAFTSADVGRIIVGEMAKLNLKATAGFVYALGNVSDWEATGKPFKDAEHVCEVVTGWLVDNLKTDESVDPTEVQQVMDGIHAVQAKIDAAKSGTGSVSFLELLSAKLRMERRGALVEVQASGRVSLEAIDSLPAILRQARGRAVRELRLQQAQAYARSWSSRHGRLIFQRLLRAAPKQADPDIVAMQSNQVPAAPETLEFIQFLVNNASDVVDRFSNLTFNYTGVSSVGTDTGAGKWQGMMKQITSFITILKPWAGPPGVKKIKDTILDLLSEGQSELTSFLTDHFGSNASSAFAQTKRAMLLQRMRRVADRSRVRPETVRQFLDGEISRIPRYPEAWVDPEAVLRAELGDTSAGALEVLAELRSAHGRASPSGVHRDVARDDATGLSVARRATPGGTESPPESAVRRLQNTTVFADAKMLVTTLQHCLPTAIGILEKVKKVNGQLSETLTTLFSTLEKKMPELLQMIAKFYRLGWIAYWALMVLLVLLSLFHGLWASGFFGGPKAAHWPARPVDEDGHFRKRTFKERMRVCGACCKACCNTCEDSVITTWAIIFVMEVIVLVVFVICLVLMIIVGVGAFVSMACGGLHTINDPEVCGNALEKVNMFLASFAVHNVSATSTENWLNVCQSASLTACSLVKGNMQNSMMLLIIGGLLAVGFHFHLIIDFAMMHERARYGRKFAQDEWNADKKREEVRGSGVGSITD